MAVNEYRAGVDPASLITRQRLDLIVKWMYYDALLRKSVLKDTYPDVESLYRRHIHARTNGHEPADFKGQAPEKQSVDDYVSAAKSLLFSLAHKGFDESRPIPLAHDGIIAGGAHRVAAAARLGLRVSTETFPTQGSSWDFEWFRTHGFDEKDLLRILVGWLRLKPHSSSVFIFWPTAIDHWDAMENHLGLNSQIVGAIDIAFIEEEREAFYSFVYDIYSYGVTNFSDDLLGIAKKISSFDAAKAIVRVVVVEIPEAEFTSTVRSVKDALRKRVHPNPPMTDFITVHGADTPEEVAAFCEILDPNNMTSLRIRRNRMPSTEFNGGLSVYASTLAKYGIRKSECCIVGAYSGSGAV